MDPKLLADSYPDGLANEHRVWLRDFDPRHKKKWEESLNDKPEDALAEAGVRFFLKGMGLQIEPGENLSGSPGGPDFLCRTGNLDFFVEVKCIRSKDADDITRHSVNEMEALCFRSLNDKIYKVVRKNAGQCGKREAPVLLAVTTFGGSGPTAFSSHYPEQILTGTVEHSVSFDPETGARLGESKTTSLYSAPFLNLDGESFQHARASVSGILLIALPSMVCAGVLNPFAKYAFPSSALPDIDFITMEVDESNRTLKPRRASELAAECSSAPFIP